MTCNPTYMLVSFTRVVCALDAIPFVEFCWLSDQSMMWNTYQNCHREFDGAIFMCNRKTKKECLARGLFGLPPSQGRFVQQIKSGMILFLFEYEERKLFGVFEASSDGGIGIVPDAFSSSGKSFPSQVRIQRVWFCYPLSEPEFYNALKDNYYTSNKFHFCLTKKQVEDLIILFSSKKIKNQVSGDAEMHYWAMDQFKKHGRGMSPMNEDEKFVEEKVSEEKVALTSLADSRHNFDICKPYFVQEDYLNKLHGQGSHSENENNSVPYRTVSAPCSDASTAADLLGEDRSYLPQYSIPCLQYLQDPSSSGIEHYTKQALVQELTKPSIPGGLMLADDPMPVPYSRFNVPHTGMETSNFSSCEADFSSSDPLVCWHGFGLQDLENVNAVDNDVHYQYPVCPFYTDRYVKRTSAFERLSFTHESVTYHENNVDASAHDLIELLAEKRKRWRVPADKMERAQHFCGSGKEHQTEQEVDEIVTLEVDDEACTSFEEADHGRRQFPNFRRRSDIRKESNNGGTSEEGDLKVDSCHVRKRKKLIRPSLSKMSSSVEHVSEENKAASQAEAGAIGQCALHLLKQHSEVGACEGLQGSFQILLGPVGCIDQNVIGQEQQKPLLQETGSNSGQLDVPQPALSVANTSCDHDESQFMRTGHLSPNPIICLGAEPEVNCQHLVDSEDVNLAGWSQAIQQESISNVGDNQDGNPILQAGPLTHNATVVLADQVVVKHGHYVHDLDELLPETIQHESTLEAVEDQSKIVQSKNENQILHTGSLPHKTQMVLAEQAENKQRHLIHDGQGDAEELSQAIHQQSTAEDVRKDESDLEQPQNGNQILQDESHPQNVKASSAEEAEVKHNYLVHDGEGVFSMMHVQKNQDIQLSHKEDQILDTGSLSQEGIITLAEAEISPENLTYNEGGELRELSQAVHLESRKATIGNDHSNLEQESTMVHVKKNQDIQLFHNGDQILDTGSLSQEEIITLAEAEISPENLTHNARGELRELSQAIHLECTKANIGNAHGNFGVNSARNRSGKSQRRSCRRPSIAGEQSQ